MFWRIVRTRGLIPLLLILAALAYWRLHPRVPKTIEVGYVADRTVPLWNTLAQVRQPVADLHYGDRVEVVRQEGTSAQVRTASGTLGWLLDTRQMMDAELWEQSASLLAHARAMPVQARGRTRTLSNVRIEPGRNAKRIFQFLRGTPVVVLSRTVADAPQAGDENSTDPKGASAEEQKPKKEDWLLVLRAGDVPSNGSNPSSAKNSAATVTQASGNPVSGGPQGAQPGSAVAGSPGTPIAGWVLARFIEPDLPGPVRDYASSANLHVVAWFELNRVLDGSGGEAPQYLVAGSRGGESQTCDFTMLRVYTWGAVRKRYETAYVESDLCGRLPIRVTGAPAGPEFRFAQAGENAAERIYTMHQTVVRRVSNKSSAPSPIRSQPEQKR
jgi:hypothetical protein